MELVGQKVINANGANQRLAQSQIEGARQKVSFAVRVQNTGTQTTTYNLLAPASRDRWKLTYYDAVEKGLNITSGISGKTGCTTPPAGVMAG